MWHTLMLSKVAGSRKTIAVNNSKDIFQRSRKKKSEKLSDIHKEHLSLTAFLKNVRFG